MLKKNVYRARNKEQRTKNKEQRTKNKEQRTKTEFTLESCSANYVVRLIYPRDIMTCILKNRWQMNHLIVPISYVHQYPIL